MRRISLGYNAVPPEAEDLVQEVLLSGQYSPGPKVREFEQKFARAHQVKHAVFVNSGTDALRLSLLAMKEEFSWKDGDAVAVTTQTFVATVNVILQAGLNPYFYDAGNPWNLARRIEVSPEKPDIVAVIPVHLFGKPCDPYIFELAEKNGWKVLEDSCETILNKPRGDASCHSTYMAHHVTTGVGGLALTDDGELNLLIRSYANHGRDVGYLPGYFKPDLGENLLKTRFQFDRIGYSSRGTEFEAALGLGQIRYLESNVQARRRVAEKLYQAISPLRIFLLDEPARNPEHTFMMFPVIAKEGVAFDKYRFCLHLEKRGIETRDLMPITSQPCYRGILNPADYPVSAHWNKNGFYIPCHPGMTGEDVEQVRDAFLSYFEVAKKAAA